MHKMKLCAKIMPNFKQHASRGYRISRNDYRGCAKLARTGQGNKFSGDMHRDIFCLIAWQLEIRNLSITFLSLITSTVVLILCISFVNDTDLAANKS